jgi:6-phosphogluconolactonase
MNSDRIVKLILGSCVFMILNAASLVRAQQFFISGYGEGIYFSSLADDGTMNNPVLLAKQFNASFFCFHAKNKDIIYAVSETMRNDDKNPAEVVAYRFDRAAALQGKTPSLTKINSQKINGDIPCHIVMDPTGKYLVIANYINGSVVVFPVGNDGQILAESSNMVHQVFDGKKSNGHCSAFSPSGQWVLVADLGLGRVYVYRLDLATGKLSPGPNPFLQLADGAGPRHIAFHPSGKYVFVINESNLTMTSASWDEATGKLTEINTTSTVPDGTATQGFSTAEVLAHPSGKFVFGSNRGHDTIVTMSVDKSTGAIRWVDNSSTLGKTPRNFRLTPNGKLLLAENQSSDNIFSFTIDQETGKLTPTGKSISVKAPACIKFLTE